MRNVLKAETLERKFPLLSVENGCIVSKDADLTVAFEVELPELYTVTAEEYEAMHSTWIKAARVLPEHSIVCKQDWFTKESYRPQNGGEEQSFLSRSYERHFNERPYLNHRCYLYLTKTTRERNRRQSDFSTLCRGFLLPREITDKDMAARFLEAVEQFEHIVNDSAHIRLRRLETEEITGTKERPGLVEKYLSLSMEDETAVLQDICLKPGRMRIGDKRLCLHTLSDTEDLPGKLSTDMRYERMSTDRSDCRLSFAAPVGLLLSCNHIYSQYVFIDNAQEILQMMEKNSRNMLSLSRYSRSNAVNQEWTEMYLDEAHTKGVLPVRCHCNVIAWAEDAEEFRRIRNDTGSQLAMMECTPPLQHRRHPGALLGGHSGQCGRLSCRRVILHVPGAGGLPLCRGDQLQKFSQSVRHPHGGPAERHSGARGHFRPSDETGHHHQPQQIYPGTKRQRQVLFHQPSGAQLLRAGSAYPAGGHGQQLSGVVPDDPRPHTRRGRHLHHV